ncbi:MAG TPA: helix-turn-helix domain-containing protein [Lacunisphaera sp.]|nr:helix-turn-helix domain-containing protein [Lacunisphaera sp.]
MDGKELAALADALIDAVVERVADRVVDKLRGGEIVGYVDQADSPLGRRRHIQAIRSGALPGTQVGRRYLVRKVDLEKYIAQSSDVTTATPPDAVEALAAELGFKRQIQPRKQ